MGELKLASLLLSISQLKLASLLFAISLCSAIGHAQEGQPNCSTVINSLHELRRNVGIPRQYVRLAESYYGDHIPWEKIEAFRFSNYTKRHCRYVSKGNWECQNQTIKKSIIDGIDEFHKENKDYIESRRGKNNTFHHYSVWRTPKSGREVTDEETGKASALLVLAADYVNLALNTILRTNTSEPWCLPIYYEGKPSKSGYWRHERYCLESSLDDYIKMATFALQDTVKSDESLNALKLAVGCIYDFELASDLTFRMALVKGLKKEEVVNYAERIWKAVQILANSPELEPGLAKLLNAVLNRLKAVDWNILSTKVYAMIINARSRTLEIDIEGMFQALHEFDYALQKGIWMYFHGEWPAMEKFVSNMVDTIKTDRFWNRLDDFYVYQLNLFKDTYIKRKDRLENYMDLLRSAMAAFIERLEYISNAVDDTAVSYVNDVNGLEIEEGLKTMVGGPAKVVTKHFLACYTRFIGKPDFEVVENMVGTELPSALYDLVFFNWPKEEIIPEGLDKFLENLMTVFRMFFSSIVGPCPRP